MYSNKIPINQPIIGQEELDSVAEVLKGATLTNPSLDGGDQVQKFEDSLANYLGCKHVVAVNSGTSALYASLLAMGVGSGDEVLVPSFTFVATVNAVLMTGATPVFVDISKNSYNIDPSNLEIQITKKTKAIIPVHLYGHPADMKIINEIAEKHNVRVIEDAAQSLGSKYHGMQSGNLSDLGCFSFYPSKVITCGEGGAIAMNDDGLWDKIRRIRTHGIYDGNDIPVLGSNLRMPEIEAAIARVQLGRLNGFLETRKKNSMELTRLLSTQNELTLPNVSEGTSSNWYLYTVSLQKGRDDALTHLNQNGIGAAVYYRTPVHKMSLLQRLGYGNVTLPNSERMSHMVVSLPVHPAVNDDQIAWIVEKFVEFLER